MGRLRMKIKTNLSQIYLKNKKIMMTIMIMKRMKKLNYKRKV